MSKKGKLVYTALAGIALLALYFLIFSFSEQDGETSGGISFRISQMTVEFWNNLTDKGWDEQGRLYWAEYFEHPIRKLAHFCEYALMGFLHYSLLRCNLGRRKLLFGVAVALVAVSAAADEIHQLFVPGRCGCVSDVLLDTCGGIFGILVCMVFMSVYNKHQRNRAKRT